MKKIMFSRLYGLEQEVLLKHKNMTRRLIKGDFEDVKAYHVNYGWHFIADTKDGDSVEVIPAYQIGEVVAVAQSYKQCWDIYQKRWKLYNDPSSWRTPDAILGDSVQETAGWTNKMFVRADLMPYGIRITDIKAERLQDINDGDCLKEGIMEGEFMNTWDRYYYDSWGDVPNHITFPTPRQAFAALIDKISGKGTWNSNPWVFAYEFELLTLNDFKRNSI